MPTAQFTKLADVTVVIESAVLHVVGNVVPDKVPARADLKRASRL
jgi:hypothetical protein